MPDEVPDGLLYSGRVPSWKAAALAILRNDLHLRSLGFQSEYKSDWYDALVSLDEEQLRLL